MQPHYNKHLLARGGARDHLYPHASAWESYEDAANRAPEGEVIGQKLTSLHTRLTEVLAGIDTKIQPHKTRKLIASLRTRISLYSGDYRLKESFEKSLSDMEVSFGSRGHISL